MRQAVKQERAVIKMPMKDGIVLVFSDAHYWPGPSTTGHRAVLHMARKLRPKVIVCNGDALDGASISRHPPIGWEHFPTLADEIKFTSEKLREIERAAPKARKVWALGNHDARFNTKLAAMVPQFKNVKGTKLMHHFPKWEPCWALELGGKQGAVVKHRFKNGVHAPHNNAKDSGRTMVTGHLHSQKVVPWTDYNGTRWGVDTGCICNPVGPQFTYAEVNPLNWRSGFAILTWRSGKLLPPELLTVIDEKKGIVWFRGQIFEV